MLSPRVVLNRVYAHLVKDADAEQREKFDAELGGLSEANNKLGSLLGMPM